MPWYANIKAKRNESFVRISGVSVDILPWHLCQHTIFVKFQPGKVLVTKMAFG